MHWGIVLAAGASSRMGFPKALLKTPEGIPLALHQLKLLESAGCAKTAVVLGSEAQRISEKLKGVRIFLNPDWESGRPSSILAALKNATDGVGIFILPVDTVGVRAKTIRKVLDAADAAGHPAIRPVCKGVRGKLVWISSALANEIVKQNLSERLDEFLADRAVALEVNDPAILSNINTPGDWEAIRLRLEQ
ncbi:MAG: NTP transferase domain-containing protein [Kiritimatiellia bacterium]